MKLYKYIGGKSQNSAEKEINNLKNRYNDLVSQRGIMDYEAVELSRNLDDLLINYLKVNV